MLQFLHCPVGSVEFHRQRDQLKQYRQGKHDNSRLDQHTAHRPPEDQTNDDQWPCQVGTNICDWYKSATDTQRHIAFCMLDRMPAFMGSNTYRSHRRGIIYTV